MTPPHTTPPDNSPSPPRDEQSFMAPDGDDPDALQTVAQAESEFEAHTIATVLKEAGIDAYVFGQLSHTMPMGKVFTQVPVQVKADDVERAQEALQQRQEDSVDLDWDEVDVGEREDHIPLSSEQAIPAFMKVIIFFIILALGALLFQFVLQLFGP